jgi:hypothetical protein
MTGQTGTQASQDDDYEFPDLPASPALDAHYEASQAIVNDARRQGTPARMRKIFPGTFSDITYAEPLAGIKLAQARNREASGRDPRAYQQAGREAGWRFPEDPGCQFLRPGTRGHLTERQDPSCKTTSAPGTARPAVARRRLGTAARPSSPVPGTGRCAPAGSAASARPPARAAGKPG